MAVADPWHTTTSFFSRNTRLAEHHTSTSGEREPACGEQRRPRATFNNQGTCVREKISAIGAVTSSSLAPLGQLHEKLDMPDHVACALGLRFRGGEWERLTRTIEAAR